MEEERARRIPQSSCNSHFCIVTRARRAHPESSRFHSFVRSPFATRAPLCACLDLVECTHASEQAALRDLDLPFVPRLSLLLFASSCMLRSLVQGTRTTLAATSPSLTRTLASSAPLLARSKMSQPTSTTPVKDAHPFERSQLESLLIRRFFYAPAFEIYGGASHPLRAVVVEVERSRDEEIRFANLAGRCVGRAMCVQVSRVSMTTCVPRPSLSRLSAS